MTTAVEVSEHVMDIFTRRPLRAALLVLSCIAAAAHAQLPPGHLPGRYPNRPIRFMVSFPPGGGADAFARILGQKLADALGQQIVIDNRAGAGGNIAAEIAARAVPDGYTLLQSTVGHAINAQHIPYKGAGPAAIDLVAGQVHMMFSAVSTVYPLIKTGRLRALGIGSLKRSVAAPEQFAAYVRAETTKWAEAVRKSGARMD